MTFWGYFRVTRPPLAILGLIAPIALVSWTGKSLIEGGFITAAVFFANLGLTLINEIVDGETDKINKPWKPVPSGVVNVNFVQDISTCFIVTSIGFLALLSIFDYMYFLIGIFGIITGYIYNIVRRDIIGNIALAITYGSAAMLCVYPHHFEFVVAFSALVFAFNIEVQYQDMIADRTAGIVTAPQQLGKLYTIVLCIIWGIVAMCILVTYNYTPMMAFVISAVCVIISAISIVAVRPDSKAQEIFNRYLGRIFMMIGFVMMIVEGCE